MRGVSRRLLGCVPAHHYKIKIAAETRSAIAGLDAHIFGFERPECCGPIPAKLRGSFRVTDHVLLNAALPPPQWAKRTENVPQYTALAARLEKDLPDASLAVCHTADLPAGALLRFTLDAHGHGRCTEYEVTDGVSALPWDVAAAQPTDLTGHCFVLICSHRARDARCGFCGPVLVDVVAQEVAKHLPHLNHVHVMPCSHFGGHVYAGNLLLYSRHGGVCFGCVTPNDVEAVVDMIRRDDGVVPDSLKDRVRGRMTRPASTDADTQK